MFQIRNKSFLHVIAPMYLNDSVDKYMFVHVYLFEFDMVVLIHKNFIPQVKSGNHGHQSFTSIVAMALLQTVQSVNVVTLLSVLLCPIDTNMLGKTLARTRTLWTLDRIFCRTVLVVHWFSCSEYINNTFEVQESKLNNEVSNFKNLHNGIKFQCNNDGISL